jgi:cytochrome c553
LYKRTLSLSASAALLTLALLANLEAADLSAGRELNERLGCAGCHGKDGIGVNEETPNLAGQDWSYLIRQLKAFADTQARAQPINGGSERFHTGMEATTRSLSYNEMKDLADYYASLSCIPERAPDISAAPEAARPCARCHGPFGINIEPGVPDLSGQKIGYLTAQLRAFRASRLGADPLRADEERYHQIMSEHAAPLTDEDIDRIAGYFAGLACP